MPTSTLLKASATSGEFSALMAARSDFALYPNAAKILENMILRPQGGVTRRPGTHYVATAKAGSGPYRLIPFERGASQAYVIEVGQGYMRFYTDQSVIEDPGVPGTPYEIATPYTSFDPFLLQWAQQEDVMILAHPDFPQQQLSRFADDDWTIAEFEFNDGPFLEPNTTATTLLASATTGTITLTASAPLFTADHVGALFGLNITFNTLPNWIPGEALAVDQLRVVEARIYRNTAAGTTGTVPPTHVSGAISDGGVTWQYLQTGVFGTVKITGFTSSTSVTAEVPAGRELPQSRVVAPTVSWREGSWSAVQGYPRAVTLQGGRVWFGGTLAQAQKAWSSAVGDFSDFRVQGELTVDPITDDGPIEASLQSSQVSAILWMMVKDNIIVGTTGGPWRIKASDNGVITPRNIQALRQSSFGCSIVPAIQVNASLLFVPRGRTQLHDLQLKVDSIVDEFESIDQTLMASTILGPGAKEMAYQSQPFSTLWVMRDDGVLSTLEFNRAEAIRGWSRQIIAGTDAAVKSITSIPGDSTTNSEDRDEVWAAVERTVNGSTVTYIEYFEGLHKENDDVHDAWHLDSGLQYTGASTTTISGLSHLEGEDVSVWGDSGALEASKTVSAGSITLDNAVTSAIVGLPTTYTYQTLPFDVGSPLGTALTKRQKFDEIRLILYLTAGLTVSQDGAETSDLYDIERRLRSTDPYDRVTGTYATRLRDASYKHNPTLTLSGNTPAPCTVLGIVPWIDTVE